MDGPGDGDGDLVDDFDTVAAALKALDDGAGTDGLPDEILLTAAVISDMGRVIVNGSPATQEGFAPVTDSLLIAGDASGERVHWSIEHPDEQMRVMLANNQAVELRSLIMSTVDAQAEATAFVVVDDGDELRPLLGASFTLSSSELTNDRFPVPFVSPPLLDIRNSALGSSVEYVVRDCRIGPSPGTGMRVRCQSARIDISDTDIVANVAGFVSVGTFGFGLDLWPEGESDISLNHVNCNVNGTSGFRLTDGPSAKTTLTLSAGCQFNSNDNGVVLFGNAQFDLNVEGTAEDLISVANNGAEGWVQFGGDTSEIAGLQVCRNGAEGLSLNPTSGSLIRIRDSLVAYNAAEFPSLEGESGWAPHNVAVRAGTASIEFIGCTFHEIPVRAEETPDRFGDPTQLFASGPVDIALRDCILSGSGDEQAFDLGQGVRVLVEDSAVVLEGRRALASADANGAGALFFNGVLHSDPLYQNVNFPVNESSFDVAAAAYEFAGPDGGPLTGYGDYVGPLEPTPTVLIVDGPGDGDADGPDNFDSIRAALASLGNSGGGDGVSDEIRITVEQLTEPTGFIVNGGHEALRGVPPATDDVTVNGDGDSDGERCVVVFPPGSWVGEEQPCQIVLADHQRVMLSDMTLIPEHGQPIPETLILGSNHPNDVIEGVIAFHRVTITASLPGNVPQDPRDASPEGTAVESDSTFVSTIRIGFNQRESDVLIDCSELVVAHQEANAFAAFAEGEVNISDSLFVNNGPATGGSFIPAHAVRIDTLGGAEATLTGVHIEDNDLTGLVANVQNSNGLMVLVGPGCVISGNSGDGIHHSTRSGDQRIEGTPENPVLISGNGEQGIDANIRGVLRVRDTVICDNAAEGLAFTNGSSDSPSAFTPLAVQHCLISGNGRAPVGDLPTNVRLEGSGLFRFDDTTVHRVAGSESPELTPQSLMRLINPGTHAILSNCIFSGSSEETAVSFEGGPRLSAALTGVVLDGPHALGDVNIGEPAFASLQRVTNADPQYVNTNCPPDADSFDVRSLSYLLAAEGSPEITGWGDFVGEFSTGLEWR